VTVAQPSALNNRAKTVMAAAQCLLGIHDPPPLTGVPPIRGKGKNRSSIGKSPAFFYASLKLAAVPRCAALQHTVSNVTVARYENSHELFQSLHTLGAFTRGS
jgi:hypothetical protein